MFVPAPTTVCIIVTAFIFSLQTVGCSHVFFGETWAGKTSLINVICGTNEPVANPDLGQTSSTTKQVKRILCGDTEVVDSIGVFDYDENSRLRIGTAEVQSALLESAQAHGLSSVLFVWPSLQRKGNPELEGIFSTLRQLLPEVPMAIVDNQFPGYKSHMPSLYHSNFGLPVLSASLDDVAAIRGWMKEKQSVFKIVLPENWRDQVKIYDPKQLRNELRSSTLIACVTVKEQLKALSDKISMVKDPTINCQCGNCNDCSQDCRREREYCCDRILGICFDHCTDNWIDENCLRQVEKCRLNCQTRIQRCVSDCEATHKQLLIHAHEQRQQLRDAFQSISDSNAVLLESCDRLLANSADKAEL